MHIHHEFNPWKFRISNILKHYIMLILLFPFVLFNNNSKMHIKKRLKRRNKVYNLVAKYWLNHFEKYTMELEVLSKLQSAMLNDINSKKRTITHKNKREGNSQSLYHFVEHFTFNNHQFLQTLCILNLNSITHNVVIPIEGA